MKDRLIILSDIHGNLSALSAVVEDIGNKGYQPDAIAILGDNINYGMRPNEVIDVLVNIAKSNHIIVNIFGNHEKALFDGDTSHFSTERGKQVLALTQNMLSEESLNYLKQLIHEGMIEHEICGKRILFVHGSLTDPFWGKMSDEEMSKQIYANYDYVISGHSHIPNFTEKFYEDNTRSEYRNKKRTIFLNPGSVGQPRNHNPRAQYLFVDIEKEIFHFNSVTYDIETERSLFIKIEIDRFYSDRLIRGI